MSRRKFNLNIIHSVLGGVGGLLHINKIVPAVMQGVPVDMMTDLAEWCSCDKPVHRNRSAIFTVSHFSFSVPVMLSFNGPPGKLAKHINIIFINYCHLSLGQWD